MTHPFAIQSAGQSHVGRVRQANEDAWLARPDLGLWAVADGMGGHERGDLASRLLVETLSSLPPTADARALREAVEAAAAAVNAQLQALAQPGGVIGTTLVLLLVHGRHYAVLWAGDSRVYRYREGRLERLSRDHSIVQELVDRGELDPDDAASHPLANMLSRAIGAEALLVLDAVQGELIAGDLYLLCSDGLTKHLADAALGGLISAAATTLMTTDATAAGLIEATLAAGATDNVTVVLVQVSQANVSEANVSEADAVDDRATRPPLGLSAE